MMLRLKYLYLTYCIVRDRGTPALLVGDSYLAFFHSSGRITHKSVITYVMGAYMFQR
jgi:uncharacterized PurR-regulated membrane protein YhhQ (DUF165 family)